MHASFSRWRHGIAQITEIAAAADIINEAVRGGRARALRILREAHVAEAVAATALDLVTADLFDDAGAAPPAHANICVRKVCGRCALLLVVACRVRVVHMLCRPLVARQAAMVRCCATNQPVLARAQCALDAWHAILWARPTHHHLAVGRRAEVQRRIDAHCELECASIELCGARSAQACGDLALCQRVCTSKRRTRNSSFAVSEQAVKSGSSISARIRIPCTCSDYENGSGATLHQ